MLAKIDIKMQEVSLVRRIPGMTVVNWRVLSNQLSVDDFIRTIPSGKSKISFTGRGEERSKAGRAIQIFRANLTRTSTSYEQSN